MRHEDAGGGAPGAGPAAAMLALVAAMPDHLAGAERLPGLDGVRPLAGRPRRVLLCGMGGSAIAGDVARPWLASQGVDLTVWREYGLPEWAGPEVPVVLASYSGDTEETVAAARAAQARGAPALAITTGGKLAAWAGAAAPAVPRVVLPPGLPPRAALGHNLGALLWGLHRLGLCASPGAEIDAAVAVLREGAARLGPAAPENEAVRLARALLGRFTVLYTSSPAAHAAGLRWKAQLNENAKSPAYCAALPELDHNDIVGWETLRRRRELFALVVLRGGDEHPRVARRVAPTRELLAAEFHACHELTARGATPLARCLSLVQLGDYVSCYLAAAAGVDPLPVARIDALKARLAEDPA